MDELKPSKILKCMRICENALMCTTDSHECAYGDDGCIDCVERLDADIQALIDAGDNLILRRTVPESNVEDSTYHPEQAEEMNELAGAGDLIPDLPGTDAPKFHTAPENAPEVVKKLWALYDKFEDQEHVVCGDAAKLLTAVPENKPLTWIPVSERLPQESGIFIICTSYGDVFAAHFWLDRQEFTRRDGSNFMFPIVHWMPLPDPQKCVRRLEGSTT